jgi:parvulin-like peptidyl-prolyl isomerase
MKKAALRILFFATISAMVFLFSSCSGDDTATVDDLEQREVIRNPVGEVELPIGSAADNSIIAQMVSDAVLVATINGMEITAASVSLWIEQASYQLQIESMFMEHDDWSRAVLEEAVRAAAITQLFMQFAEQNNISLTDDEVAEYNAHIAMMQEMYGEEMFQQMLLSDGIFGMEHLQLLFHDFTLMDKVIEIIVDDPVLFARFSEFYEEVEEVAEEEILGAKHILIANNFITGLERTDEEILSIATGIHARILLGEDFDTLMHTYSEDSGLEVYPEGYTFASGAMVPEFEEATRALAIGEISGPVVAFHGVHIIMRTVPSNDPDAVLYPQGHLTPNQRRAQAVYMSFQEQVENSDVVFLAELYNIPVEPLPAMW